MKQHLSLMAILSLSLLNASGFQPLGGNSMSMGGAGVASATGSLAGYYNPALLTETKGVEVSLGLGIGVRENNIGEQIDSLSNSELTDVIERIADNSPHSGTNSASDRESLTNAQNILSSIGDENGISLMPSAYLGIQYDNMAIGLYSTSEIVISANIDSTHLASIVEDDGTYYNYNASNDTYGTSDVDEYNQHSLEYALDNNLTTLNATGLVLSEVPISYARALDVPLGKLSIGGSLKLMHGTTYTQTLSVDSDDSTDEDTLKANQRDSDNIGVDLGVLFKPNKYPALTVGLVAKNLNAPSFETSNGKDIKADMQVRSGVQYRLRDDLELAADLDLTTNKTLINGYESQMFGGGINYHPVSWFALRGGAMQNLANSNEGIVYTAGLAFGLQQFQLDISAQMSSKTGTYDGDEIPKYAKVNVALVSKW